MNMDILHSLSEDLAMPVNSALKHMFELSIDMLCVANFQGYFILANPAFSTLLGYKPSELLAKPFIEFVHPEDQQATLTELGQLGEGVLSLNFENRYRCKSGEYVWLGWRARPDVEKRLIFAVARDVTKQKKMNDLLKLALEKNVRQLTCATEDLINEVRARQQTHRQLTDSEKRYSALTSIAPLGIYYTDNLGQLIYANDKWHKLLGIKNKDTKDISWYETIHPDDLKGVLLGWQAAFNNYAEFEICYRCQYDDKEVFVMNRACPLFDAENQFAGYLGTITDMTRINEAEKKIEQLRRELAHSDRVSVAGELATGIAHEVNQPLTAIMQYVGGCQLRLRSQNIEKETYEALQNISMLAKKASIIINRLRDFVCVGKVIKTKAAINNTILNIMPIIQHRLKKHNIELILNLSDNLPKVCIDSIQIQQVIINIISNSIEALRKRLKKSRCIIITTQYDEASLSVKLIIEDNGTGIEKKLKEKIFERFVSTKRQGMGIGLSISRSIVEAHNGTIDCDSQPDSHTVFTVTLPTTF